MTEKNVKDHRYGIGAVARLTGLTDHTIRAWERRYGAVVARRASNGRRQYSAADLEKLGLLKLLTDQGVAISLIANENADDLRERARDFSEASLAPAPSEVRVAVLGDLLPSLLAKPRAAPAPLDIVVADSNRARFEADLNRERIDVIVLESPVLDPETISQLQGYLELAGVTRGIIVYTFARSRDIETARRAQLIVLRAPCAIDELSAGVLRTYTGTRVEPSRKASETPVDVAEPYGDSTIAPRRFDQQQIANLANTQSEIDCECPRHLAQLVSDLSAFEIYSAQCANRDEDDAALHRFLHHTTAEARAMIEKALERVAKAEGLSY